MWPGWGQRKWFSICGKKPLIWGSNYTLSDLAHLSCSWFYGHLKVAFWALLTSSFERDPLPPPRISWWISIKKNSYFQISLAKLCDTASFSRCDLEAAVTVKFYLSMFQTSIWAHILCGWLFLRLGFGEHVFEAEVEAEVRLLEVARGRFWPRSNLTSWDLGKSFEYH